MRLIIEWVKDYFNLNQPKKGYQRYKILLKNRFFAIRFKGRYRRDLEANNWHYYEDDKGLIWHFRKENIQGVYGDTPESVLENK